MLYRNTQKRKESSKKWRLNHKEHIKKYTEKWRLDNKERVKKYKKNNYNKHKKRIAEKRAFYRGKNQEKIRTYKKAYIEKNRDKHNFLQKKYKYRRRGASGTHVKKQWEELKRFFNYCCLMCGMQEPFTNLYYQKLTEDHIIPISKGGSNNIENIQPLCQSCNSKKHNKIIKDN